MNDVFFRAGVGWVTATGIAAAAHRLRALSSSGAIAAIVCGTIVTAAGWMWGIVLITYFILASAVSKIGARRKAMQLGDLVARGATRDAVQVLANGAVYVLAAFAMVVSHETVWMWAGLSALAASAADTWATELGALLGQRPRSILTGALVLPGTSGGVSWQGTAASVAGAGSTAGIAAVVGWPASIAWGALVAGVIGAFVDSVLGATVQMRRRCPVCQTATEQTVHTCGSETQYTGGVRWMTNDTVNACATLAGGLIGAAAWIIARSA